MSVATTRMLSSLAVAFIGVTVLLTGALAQAPQTPTAGQPSPAFERITVTAGRSHVLTADFDVTRIGITNAAIADANAVTPREILIDSKAPGLTSLILWGLDRRQQYDLVVEAVAQPLQQQIQQQLQTLFPNESIRVATTEEAIVLAGDVSTSDMAQKAGDIAQAFSAKLKVVNLLQRPGRSDPQQVLLEVQFAEVEHSALLEVGASFLMNRPNVAGGISTRQFAAPEIDDANGGIQVADYLNVFLLGRKEGLLAIVKALRDRGAFQSLAEPNLIAYNGQEASFLAGGEFPVPFVEGSANAVTVQFKEFGVRLTFTPTITGDTVRLKVKPEVSTIDFTNGVTISGFRIPALKTRRAETDVELHDGQPLAIAGLLDNQAITDQQSVPLLSSIPIVGAFFKSKSDRAVRTELLVIITPHLIRSDEPIPVKPLPVMDPKAFITPPDISSTAKPDAAKP